MDEASVVGKIVFAGELVLDEPLLIGDGETARTGDTDICVLRDKKGVPYIPGTSLAGVLRSFLRDADPLATALLFGSERGEAELLREGRKVEVQSSLSFGDVMLSEAQVVLRDGVSIDGATGVALKHHKFDYEAVDSGAHGSFRLEGTLRKLHDGYEEEVSRGIELLQGKLAGGFYVGARTTKGFGRVHLQDLTIDRYDFKKAGDVLSWLGVSGERGPAELHKKYKGDGTPCYGKDDFMVEADFSLRSSLIVRDYEADAEGTAVMKQDSRKRWIIPGSSLKGVMRHRAEYILGRLGKDAALTEKIMGPSLASMKERPNEAKRKSRFMIDEAALRRDAVKPAKQSRNRIDRFTGGTVDTALFSTKPVWQKEQGAVSLKLRFGITRADDWEAGLVLLLLKDLWSGRVAVGGEKSIGRGVLEGVAAKIFYRGKVWQISPQEKVSAETEKDLQELVDALVLAE